jgi:putative nucleotidyltransferase with HDIG domain
VRQANLKKIIDSVSDFPTLPSVVARVIQILDNPYSSASDLTDIITHDQAMMFRILKMANSAYYGFPRAIATVTESIVLLGFSTVRNLILTTMMYNFDQMWMKEDKKKSGESSALFNHWQEWKHSVATAVAARELLISQHQEASEHLGYLAGLMHDVGKILFYHYFREDYQKVLERHRDKPGNLSDLEKEIMGASHGQVGAWIVDRWNLPEDIVAPIASHHAPEKAKKNKPFALILNYADVLAHGALDKVEKDPAADTGEEPPLLTIDGLDFSAEQVVNLEKKIQQEMSHIESFMVV